MSGGWASRELRPIASRFVDDELHFELDARLRKRNTLFRPGLVIEFLGDLDRRGIELGKPELTAISGSRSSLPDGPTQASTIGVPCSARRFDSGG